MASSQEIKTKIEFDIISGVYQQSGKLNKLPSINELASKYNCARGTIGKIIDELCEDGIVVKRERIGCFIKPFIKQNLYDKKIDSYEKRANDLIIEMKSLGVNKDVLIQIIMSTIDKVYD